MNGREDMEILASLRVHVLFIVPVVSDRGLSAKMHTHDLSD